MPPKHNKDSGSPLGHQLHQLPWLIMGVVVMLWILAAYFGTGVQATQIPYSEFKAMIRQDAFQEVILGTTAVRGTVKTATGESPKTYEAVRPEDPDLLRELEARNVRYRVEVQNPWLFHLLSWVVPIVLLFFLWRFFIGRVGAARVRDLFAQAYERAHKILVAQRGILDTLAHLLLEKETIEGDEVRTMMQATR